MMTLVAGTEFSREITLLIYEELLERAMRWQIGGAADIGIIVQALANNVDCCVGILMRFRAFGKC